MDTREQKGMEIAALVKIRKAKTGFVVPSQTTNGVAYTVNLDGDYPTCNCPDYENRMVKCKHIYAVGFSVRREQKPDGTMVETKTMRVTYAQNWPAYNQAQIHEEEQFVRLLRGLTDGIVQPVQTMGRPRLPLADVVFASVYKTYSTMSGRRAMSCITDALGKAPAFQSTARYLENPALTPLLKTLIEESALPLKGVECDFAVDSSGFSTSVYSRWFDHKYGRMHMEQQWVKAHLMVGVKTNVVTSIEVTGQNVNDSPVLPTLLERTVHGFNVQEVSADKGYISHKNLQTIVDAGAVPYIPFKVNTTGQGPALWQKLYHFYQFNRPDFLAHYHKRSNVETTFSMIKAKFGAAVRAKTATAQVNEVLCKVLAHNICCLIASIYELGIQPTFETELAGVSNVGGF